MPHKNKISVIVALLILVGFGALFYFTMNKETTKQKDVNLTFSLDFKGSSKSGSGEIHLGESSIISKNEGLQQRLHLGKLTSTVEGKTETFFDSFDIIRDNQFAYTKQSGGKKQLFPAYINLLGTEQTKLEQQFTTIAKQNKYVKIDNAKALKNIFTPEFNNKIITEILTGLATDNPNAYLKQKRIGKQIIRELQTDSIINYLFKEVNTQKDSGKSYLMLNPTICETTIPVIQKLSKILEPEAEKIDTQTCKEQLSTANTALAYIVQIYKQGDAKNGNFSLFVEYGSIAALQIDYKNHKLTSWTIKAEDPQSKDNRLYIKGNTRKILESDIQFTFEEEGITAIGSIKNGKGDIKLSGESSEAKIKAGDIIVKNYQIEKIDIEILEKKTNKPLQISGFLKINKGKIEIKPTEEFGNILITYDTRKGDFYMNTLAPAQGRFIADINFKKRKQLVEIQQDNKTIMKYLLNEKAEFEFIFAEGKNEMNAKGEWKDGKYIITGNSPDSYNLYAEIQSYKNFNAKFHDKIKDTTITINTEREKNTTHYTVQTKDNSATIDILDATLTETNENGKNKAQLIGTINSIENKEAPVTFDATLYYQKGVALYEIPENTEEVEVNLLQSLGLPPLYLQYYKDNWNSYTTIPSISILAGYIYYINNAESHTKKTTHSYYKYEKPIMEKPYNIKYNPDFGTTCNKAMQLLACSMQKSGKKQEEIQKIVTDSEKAYTRLSEKTREDLCNTTIENLQQLNPEGCKW